MTKFTAEEANAFLAKAFPGRGHQNQVLVMETGRAVIRLEADETIDIGVEISCRRRIKN